LGFFFIISPPLKPRVYSGKSFLLCRINNINPHIFIKKAHIIILEHAFTGWIYLNSTLRTIHYPKKYAGYPLHLRRTGKNDTNNWKTILAKKVITQALICIFILFAVVWLQNKTEEIAEKVITQIKMQLVEQHISAGEIYQSLADAYDECVQYIQGVY
jgi:hypothetical protein